MIIQQIGCEVGVLRSARWNQTSYCYSFMISHKIWCIHPFYFACVYSYQYYALLFSTIAIFMILLFSADEYDHLNYSRPCTSVKQHYHRMDKPLNITVEENEAKENNLGLNNLNAPSASSSSAAIVADHNDMMPSTSSTSSTVSAASSPDDNVSQCSGVSNVKHLKDLKDLQVLK